MEMEENGIEERTSRLTSALEAVERQLAGIVRAIRSNRVRTSIIAGTVAFDLLLSIFLGYMFQRVERNSDAIAAMCEAGNTTAAREHVLWGGVIAISLQPRPGEVPPTPAQKKDADRRLGEFNVLLDKTFPQEDCPIKATSTWVLLGFGALALTISTGVGYLLYRKERRQDEQDVNDPLIADVDAAAEDKRHALEDRVDDAAEAVRHARDD